ncbi:MAG TPA: RNA-binding protein [Usitatibacter sp.]|nr:RNA-binding protein [Usitatibacter sp.]
MKVWIGNIAPGTSDDELRALFAKYGVPEVTAIEQVPGDGSRPAAIVEVAAAQEAVSKLTMRLNGMYWKDRSLIAQAILR